VQKNAYDGLTRRITKEASSVVTHTYWSDRWKPLEERTGSSTSAARSYLWGERPGHRDELILRDRDTDGNGSLDERLYATMDYFNGTAILNTSGVVQERYAYSAFGIRRIMAPDFTARSTSSLAWEFGFQGQFRDNETGWSNYGYRFYVPELGRWINRDPIGEEGGANLYGFAGNDGINNADYLGAAINPDNVECCGEKQYDSAEFCCYRDRDLHAYADIDAALEAVYKALEKGATTCTGGIDGWSNCADAAAAAVSGVTNEGGDYWVVGLEGRTKNRGAWFMGRHHMAVIRVTAITIDCGYSSKTYDGWNPLIGGQRDDRGEYDEFKTKYPKPI
jgi:RHS repeat-associated protein